MSSSIYLKSDKVKYNTSDFMLVIFQVFHQILCISVKCIILAAFETHNIIRGAVYDST